MAPKRRTRRALKPPASEPARRGDALRDISHAIGELELARDELANISLTLTRFDRDAALVEPLARVSLVQRFCAEILRRYDWSSRG